MTRRSPAPVGPPELADQLVAQRHTSYIEAAYAPKLICRTSDQLSIGLGNHSADGLVGPIVSTSSVACLHAPLRSARTFCTAPPPETAWRTRSSYRARHGNRDGGRARAEELEVEWRANSYDGRAGLSLDVYGFEHPVIVDTLLRDTVVPHYSLRDRAIVSLAWRRHVRDSR